ncbi:MAG: hypothetical protein ACLFN1_05765 [Bacteroidales bacterium]
MKILPLAILMILLSVNLTAQNVLGFTPGEIVRYVKENHRNLVRDDNSRNEYYDYLKYTDGTSGTTTVYFFLSEDKRCSRVKRIHVHSLKDEVRRELDSLYVKKEDNTWIDEKKDNRALIRLLDEEWFFTVNIEPGSKK